MRRNRLPCWHKRFKISHEVATLDVAVPFTMALDDDATILSPAMVDELTTEVGCRDAWQHARRWRCMRSREGAPMCYCRLLPPSLMVRSVDGCDDELIDVVVPLLCG
jgi:hypothetical protein